MAVNNRLCGAERIRGELLKLSIRVSKRTIQNICGKFAQNAPWAWPKEIWIEVIQTALGRTHTSGTRFWMLLLAYLFCDMFYTAAATVYGAMAEVIFGRSVVEK